MTLAIPLQILVRVHDDPASVSIASLAVEGAVEGDRPADSAVMTAIALARQNRNLPPHEYYDDQADSADRTAYYEHIDGGVGPAALYSALSVLITDTHRTKLEYSPSTQLYPEVDIQPDGTILSVYSSRQMDPVDLIRADAEIDRARRAALRVLAESETLSIDDVALFTNRIEAAFPYNCEHVVPQSWFAKRHPMKGDLHHLFACEVKCNEFRANTPYFDFTPDGNPRAGCGRSEPGRFEPVGGKGDVARATLYFLLRYPGEIDNNSREYTSERLEVLLNWHREKPVSLHERHRNRAIQRKQGNRNPLIDHPEWAERVDWSRGLR